MKISKKLYLILILSFLFIITQISCDSKEQVIEPSAETQSELESSNNIYFEYPVRDYPIGKSNDSKLYWDCSENDFGNYLGGIYDGFHSGEDWNLKGGKDGSIDLGKPVYSIGKGKVVRVSNLGNLGYLVVIEHDGNCIIPKPSKEINSNGQKATYEEEVVDKIYSVYIHLSDVPDKYNKADENNLIDVDVSKPIGYIMKPSGGSHLHFEIRKNNDNHSGNWSLLGNNNKNEAFDKNWQFNLVPDKKDPTKQVKVYNGYYINLQEMIDAGLRDPSDFIEANYKRGEEYKSQEEVVEEVINETWEEETYKTTAEGKIAFTSDRDGLYEIYIMNADGSGQRRLTDNPEVDSSPSFSPDGSKIAFTSDRDGNWEIYIMNIDGSGQTNLTNNLANDGEPSFSPDGSKIAFTSNRDGNIEMYIMNADGSEQRRLTDNLVYDGEPCFSPDGSKIAFVSYRDGNGEIYIMNIDGSGQVNLSDNPEWDEGPCFSPDGSKIAFTSDRDENYEIYIMNIDGSDQRRLTDNPVDDRAPCFSP